MDNRIGVTLCSISIIILVGVGFLLAMNLVVVPDDNTLEWADISNTNVTYNYTTFAGTASSNEAPLNYSQILFTIIYLPEVPLMINAESYVRDVAKPTKVNLTSVIGTEIHPFRCERISELVSFMTFPVGDWEFIESLFDSKVEITLEGGQFPIYYTYVGSSTSSNEYTFNSTYKEQGSGHTSYKSTTFGKIDKTTGIPTYIEYYYCYFWNQNSDYTMILTRLY
jgi:hypothetical protein